MRGAKNGLGAEEGKSGVSQSWQIFKKMSKEKEEEGGGRGRFDKKTSTIRRVNDHLLRRNQFLELRL